MITPRDQDGSHTGIPGRVRLVPQRSRRMCKLLLLLVTISFGWTAGRVWLAAEYAASSNPLLWRRAAEWQPQNAAYWAQLGSMETWDIEREDLVQAQADYERAVEANPHSDRNWLELATVYERRGEVSKARGAYDRARYNHPISSAVAWRYGNFLVRQGNAGDGCVQFREALLISPELTGDVVAEWWKSGLYNSQPIATVLPPENRFYFRALNYFEQQNEINAVLRVWDELLRLQQRFELPQAVPFIDEAIAAGRVADAQKMWRQAVEASAWPRDANQSSLLIFNGGFEYDFAGGGFDWREQKSADYSFVFDRENAHSGARSLRIVFSGNSNLDFHDALEYVVLEPAHRYRFMAFLKSSALSTDSGVRFLIAGSHASMPDIVTGGVTGTQPWTGIETEFTNGPDTQMVSISLRRTPSSKFDNKLGGTVWVDDVSLVALAANAAVDRQ